MKEVQEEPQSRKSPAEAYTPYDYRRFVESRENSDADRVRSSSVNALGSLAATIGVGSMIAGKNGTGATIAGGAAGGMAGFHVARIAKASPAVQLLAAAIGSTLTAGVMYKTQPFGIDK